MRVTNILPRLAFLVTSCLLVLASFPAVQGNQFPVLEGPYFGQEAPRDEAGLFMDGVISKEDEPEMNAGFSVDGKEFYFCARHRDDWAIFSTREEDGRWLEPAPLPFTSDYTDRDFTLSPDGRRIYFGSNRPRTEGGPKLELLDIVFTERSPDGGWSDPVNVGPAINTDYGENYPCAARNGNLYFFSCREDGLGGCDLYMARWLGDRYESPTNLGDAINSEKNDWDATIAPDESCIIFSSQERGDTLGGQDLYISFRKEDGTWTAAKNMGDRVNSESGEICPSVSLDGKYLFFTSRRRGKADIYWMTVDVIEDLKRQGS
jgi:Tol biopolymer transport system component